MQPLIINGQLWRVVRVHPSDPSLFDRTGNLRLATTDPKRRVISVASNLEPPLLDRVMIHEAAHAITMAYNLLGEYQHFINSNDVIASEEWAAGLVEKHGLEAAELASEALGRPVCVKGVCHDRS